MYTKKIWTAVIGEMFSCIREPGNTSGRYSVAINAKGWDNLHLHNDREIQQQPSLQLISEHIVLRTICSKYLPEKIHYQNNLE